MTTPTDYRGQPHDFDFLVGRWQVRNRRLRQRHVGGTDWDEFEALSQAWTHLDGQVSVDELAFEGRGFKGCTLRTLDLAARRWSIYWINSGDGRLGAPVVGGWSGARGVFAGGDLDDGRPVRVRFLWERLDDGHARWSQDFALAGAAGQPDGAWETNWVMEMRRLD